MGLISTDAADGDEEEEEATTAKGRRQWDEEGTNAALLFVLSSKIILYVFGNLSLWYLEDYLDHFYIQGNRALYRLLTPSPKT